MATGVTVRTFPKQSYWTGCVLTLVDDIMGAVMPGELKDDFPTGFSVVGHVGRHRHRLSHIFIRDFVSDTTSSQFT